MTGRAASHVRWTSWAFERHGLAQLGRGGAVRARQRFEKEGRTVRVAGTKCARCSAWRSWLQSGTLRAFCGRLIAADPKKLVLTAAMRKLVVILNALIILRRMCALLKSVGSFGIWAP